MLKISVSVKNMISRAMNVRRGRIAEPRQRTDFLSAKALYDEAHTHLKQYEILYARAYAIDLACRRMVAATAATATNTGGSL